MCTLQAPNNGTVVPQDVMVQGRKIPLYKLRQKLLQKHSMHLDTVNTMTREQLTTKLKRSLLLGFSHHVYGVP